MALILKDRVCETTTVTGIGPATLLGATIGFQSFVVIGNANTTYYCIADQAGFNWEVGIGTYTSSGATLTRTTILASSNGGALVVFTAGVKDVFVTYPSEKGVWYDASGNVLFTGTTTATNLAYTGTLTGSTGILNIGSGQLYKDASGNVGIGTSSPSTKLTVAGAITITGAFALRGSYGAGAITSNFAAGDGALISNTTGPANSAVGVGALQSNTTGSYNSAVGADALHYNTTGVQNTAMGVQALLSNTTGNNNSAMGLNALVYNTTGTNNSAVGVDALRANTTGNYNAAVGTNALTSNTTGYSNSAVGVSALQANTTGSSNSAVGVDALHYNTTGSGNSAFNPHNSAGTYAPVFNPTTENNRFCMGSTGVTNAYIQVAWTVVSDARDKTNFAPVPHGLDFVNQLKPTAYQFKEDRETDIPTGIVRYGFKAQDILELEGDTPVIIDTEDLDKLRFNSDSLIPVLVNAIKELTTRLQILEGKK